ncbi:putative trans-sialidase, Group V [Trypanosoma cruzi]|uniref:Trans-sialidase, putative n=2 Tax=Trypanosoma cruzi TaxID=5693 RepID=Q4DXP2_TRYCC|nr:trans-sialidase, putative [Trypanosoma cruzi]EAN97295.1 trans-sialidase, putative [Trypanosoma cruzi]PWV21303.1 putative trans-sialidase, Group V [Trypanosoma cruzi]RNC40386.1 amastigote surface protein 4 [Trypanosoma cruzi]|eukprot:XP_819146.1 trans-sialidase [Trypanosoma cruzi strain CL Brener]
MSRRVFTSAVLLLVVMMCCGSGVAQGDGPSLPQESSLDKRFVWRDTTGDETVSSLRGPSLVEVNGKVFAVAEAQWTKGENSFTGIASKLLTLTDEPSKEELDANNLKTQVLEECPANKEGTCSAGSEEKCGCRVADQESDSPNERKVHVSRPTTVVNGNDIYMFVGNYSRTAATGHEEGGTDHWGLLLVKGQVSGAVEEEKRICWNDTHAIPLTLGDQHKSLTALIGGGGSGVKMNEGTLVFPVEGTKKKENDGAEKNGKTVSLVLCLQGTEIWKLSKEVPDDGCSDPSVVEWKDKLMMMTACVGGRRRVYESGDKGESWTEALGTLSRVWGSKENGNVKGVRSGFITATIDGVGGAKRNVMLVTLPVYPEKEKNENENGKGELHLWLTDNTHIVDIGSVSSDDDVAASSLLYKSGNNNDEEELITLYEKKKGESSSGMVSVLLTAQLKRVKEVLTTWKEVDGRVSELCPFENAKNDAPTDNACSAVKITDGLVGFLSGNFSDGTWRDEYLGVNATVSKRKNGVGKKDNGVTFKGRGAGAEWPVGRQGENQLYHFANYNFTLLATVSIHGVPEEGDTPIPLMGAKMNDDSENTVLLGLSYKREGNWAVLCSGQTTKKHSNTWEPQTQYQVAIVLNNGTQGSVYVDGQRVGDESCVLKSKDPKGISHFYIGGDGGSAEGQEGFSVTATNVLLYNRPLDGTEITALAKNKITIPKPEGPNTLMVDTPSTVVSGPVAQKTVSVSTPGGFTVNHESSASSGEVAETVGGTNAQGEEGIHSQDGEVNAAALNSSPGNLSQGNNSDGGTMRGSGLLPLLLLLLGLWGYAAL